MWLRLYLTPKRDHAKTDNQIRATVILIGPQIDTKINGVCFFHIDISLRTTLSDTCPVLKTLSETKICNLHP